MKKIDRITLLSALVVLAYVLSACSGVPAGQVVTNDQQGQAQDVVFTGTVDSVNGNQWTISGQTITAEDGAVIGANIAVGDNVKVEARVASDGSVTAVSIEIAGADNSNSNTGNGNDSNTNGSNTNGSNTNDNTSNSNDNQGDNSNASNDNGNTNVNGNGNGNDNSNTAGDQEVSGMVDAITTDSITIDGVVYTIADFTEFKDLIALGDNVKVHVIVNADGTLTIREIEKTAQSGLDNSNSNSNSNGSDDHSNVNSNSNGDDHGNDNGGNDNGDDHSNDNDSHDNSNDSGGGNGNGNG